MALILQEEATTRAPTPVEAQRRLESRVEGVRRRWRANFILAGLGLGLAGLAVAFLGFSLADVLLKFSISGRLAALALGLAGLFGLGGWACVRPWLRLGGRVSAARQVERTYPELENQVSTALEFGSDARKTEQRSSPALVGALLQQAHDRAAPLSFGRTVRWRRALLALLAIFLAGAAVAFYASASPRLFRATLARFLNPFSNTPAPTLTVIESVQRVEGGKLVPADGEAPLESDVSLVVTVSGLKPDSATLRLLTGEAAELLQEGRDAPWRVRILEADEAGRFHGAIRRVSDTTLFQIRAGDAESRIFTLRAYREPRIEDLTVRLEYPKYTRKAPEALPSGQADVKALRGTQVTVHVTANTEIADAWAAFESGRQAARARPEGRKAAISFPIEKDDRYQLFVRDRSGRENPAPMTWNLRALPDLPPRVAIRKPERDLLVHREQTVKIEVSSADDFGVQELGLCHTLGLQEEQTLVRRLDPALPNADGRHTWELGRMKLKSGEVIAYYAYAKDTDEVGGPKISKSDLHFLTVYDEEDYESPQQPGMPGMKTPESVRSLDKLIEEQKKLLQQTFNLGRNREAAGSKPPSKPEESACQSAGKLQGELRKRLAALVEAVKQELAKQPEAEVEKAGEDGARKTEVGERELKLMDSAGLKMETAAVRLNEVRPQQAVKPELEALRELSETRRLLLSDKEGDPRFRAAMNNASRRNKNRDNQQKQQDMNAAREELTELPKMMEREEQTEREIERLREREEEVRRQAPRTPLAEQKQKEDELRRLKRELQEQLDRLAKDTRSHAEKMDDLAKRNEELKEAARKSEQAAQRMEQAGEAMQRQESERAESEARAGGQNMRDARRELQGALERNLRQELSNLLRDAEDLSRRQEDLAESTRQAAASGAAEEQARRRLSGLAGRQDDLNEEAGELGRRVESAAEKAQEKQLPSAAPLESARDQSGQNSEARRQGRTASEELRAQRAARAEEAQREAVRSFEKLAQSLREAAAKTEAADLKELAAAARRARELEQQQAEIKDALEAKREPGRLVERQNKVAAEAQELAQKVEQLAELRRRHKAGEVREKLEQGGRAAQEAARRLAASDPAAGENAGEARERLDSAARQLEAAAGKTLAERALEARQIAQQAREQQEKAAAGVRELPQAAQPLKGEEAARRDEAAQRQRQAARFGRRLEGQLEALDELSSQANPAAAQAAREALERSRERRLPQAMQELAREMERVGEPAKDEPPAQPREAARKGEDLARAVKQIEGDLDRFLVEAKNDRRERLQSLHRDAQEAAKLTQELAAEPAPAREPPAGDPRLKELERDLDRLRNRLQTLGPIAPEADGAQQARAELKQLRERGAEMEAPQRGASLGRVRKHLESVVAGLVERLERLQREREIRADEEGPVPREYRGLAERYTRALSDTLSDDRENKR
jgi:hypothetical protein